MDTAADVIETVVQSYVDFGVVKAPKGEDSPRKSLKVSTDLDVDPLARARGIAASYRSLVQVYLVSILP
jgi:hypothetical protein